MRDYDNWKLRSDRDDRGRYDPEPEPLGEPPGMVGITASPVRDAVGYKIDQPEPLGDIAQTILDRLRRKMEQRKNERQSRRDKVDR